ncbi:MAG TPA: GNAT family protein [Mycobacteriales bacterium]|nr:GNAT family protein [Mycobacteriales bacterium]
MLAPQPVTLTRGRVSLEPWTQAHDADLLRAASPTVFRWLPTFSPTTLEEVAAIRESHPGLAWAVVVDGKASGSTSYLDVDTELGGLEIGWTWYGEDLWATDVNPTCKLLLLAYAFEELGAGRVLLKTDALNARSRAAIGKLGCAYDGTLRHHRLRPDGSVRDTAFFSMLAAEWPVAKQRLLHRLG